MTGWISAKLKDLPIDIIDGDRSARYPKRHEFRNEGVLFLNTTNIDDNRLDLSEANFIASDKFDEIKKGRLRRFDIVMTTRGSVGKVALFNCSYSTGLINAQMLILRADGHTVDNRFLFYLLRSDTVQGAIRNFASGSAQPQIPIQDLREIDVSYPPLPTQRKIAVILSAYDDLIENNIRRIKILEEMARVIYREWFINFRFPGYEKVKTTNSGLGPIPVGWKLCKVGDIIELAYGKALRAGDRREGPFPVFGSSGVVGHHCESLVEGPGIIVGRKGNVGSVFWSDESFYPIDTVYFVRTEVSLYYAFFNLQHQNFLSSDAAVPGLNRNYAYSLPIVIPSSRVLEAFDDFCVPVFEELKNLRARNGNLRRTRDLLLPKLISGELGVENLDIAIPEAEQTLETTPVASSMP